MDKSPDAFRTISEVADWLGIPAHVLRFWESKFTQIKPVKRAGGRRYYRPADMQLLGGIKKLLHDDGMTIKGVQKALREQGVSEISSLSQSLDEPATGDQIAGDGTVLSFKDKRAKTETSPPEQPEQIESQAEPVTKLPKEQPAPAPPPDLFSELENPTTKQAAAPSEPQTASQANPESQPLDAPQAKPKPEPKPEPEAAQHAETSAEPTTKPAAPEPQPSAKTAPAETPPVDSTPVDSPPVDSTPAETTAPAAPVAPSAESPSNASVLPSFLHRPATRKPPPEPVSEPQPTPDPVAAVRTAIVDAPDPPDENELPYTPGLLAKLAGLRLLTPEQARAIAPLTQQLRDHITRTGSP